MSVETTPRTEQEPRYQAIVAETMAEWNTLMEERRATMVADIAALDAEGVAARQAELEHQISDLETEQRDLFRQTPTTPESAEHRAEITRLEGQLLMLRMERGIIERRS